MPHIAIISSSVRTGRRSHRVALYFEKYLKDNELATTEIIDLDQYDFPIFEERIWNLENPPDGLKDFSNKIDSADGIIIITPEYNGGYPASLKNAIDATYKEWHRKPVAISTVSRGIFGGTQVIMQLQFVLWKMRAWTVPAMFPVREIEKSFDESGVPSDVEGTDKRAKTFIGELLWCVGAGANMKSSD